MILSFISADCQIELFGIKLTGKQGARKWISWLHMHVHKIKSVSVTIVADGNTFFEEFIVKTILYGGVEVQKRGMEISSSYPVSFVILPSVLQ